MHHSIYTILLLVNIIYSIHSSSLHNKEDSREKIGADVVIRLRKEQLQYISKLDSKVELTPSDFKGTYYRF